MKDLMLSEAIGDIAGSAYEFSPTKDYDSVQLFHPRARFTDDTVCTFACAEALLHHTDIAENLRTRCLQHANAGYGGRFRQWIITPNAPAYNSYGNGSAMRCSAAAWLAQTEQECIELATATALPTHNHPEGIKGAVVAALTTYHLKQGHDKDFIRKEILLKYYPDWAALVYKDFHQNYDFDVSCQGSVGPAIICFLESKDYTDCIKLCIALGGDSDTLAAIAGPMAYAYYKEMPATLVVRAKQMLPPWMLEVNDGVSG